MSIYIITHKFAMPKVLKIVSVERPGMAIAEETQSNVSKPQAATGLASQNVDSIPLVHTNTQRHEPSNSPTQHLVTFEYPCPSTLCSGVVSFSFISCSCGAHNLQMVVIRIRRNMEQEREREQVQRRKTPDPSRLMIEAKALTNKRREKNKKHGTVAPPPTPSLCMRHEDER